eukprot:42520-Eustigmatos_ZCMA.PRE.1
MAGDILAMVSGHDEDISGHDKFYSRIREISSRVWRGVWGVCMRGRKGGGRGVTASMDGRADP